MSSSKNLACRMSMLCTGASFPAIVEIPAVTPFLRGEFCSGSEGKSHWLPCLWVFLQTCDIRGCMVYNAYNQKV